MPSGFIIFVVDVLSDRELIDLLTMHEVVMSKKGINEFYRSPKVVSNQRRCVEARHHICWYAKEENELCNIEAVYARAKCG